MWQNTQLYYKFQTVNGHDIGQINHRELTKLFGSLLLALTSGTCPLPCPPTCRRSWRRCCRCPRPLAWSWTWSRTSMFLLRPQPKAEWLLSRRKNANMAGRVAGKRSRRYINIASLVSGRFRAVHQYHVNVNILIEINTQPTLKHRDLSFLVISRDTSEINITV